MAGRNIVTVASCTLNQWALDFDGNRDRILQSCEEARHLGASYRLGPELEVCGYGCEDHFLELDTFQHCWESLETLFDAGATDSLLCDFGMPILFGGARYNCRIICHNRKILLIRPKTAMADNGNYREGRYFTAYQASDSGEGEEYLLSASWKEKYEQTTAPFGLMSLQAANGANIGCESCEELWTPKSAHINMSLNGVEIIGNGSGSHHELRKLHTRLELMISATRKCGGLYLYSNQRGCDGGRCYYDGGSMIVLNGEVLAQANQFDVHDVQTIAATVDLNDIKSYRASIPSFGVQVAQTKREERSPKTILCEDVDMGRRKTKENIYPKPSVAIELSYSKPEEECCKGPACWLWDYLRRSGASGFFLPLSGGADSTSTATIVHCMCILVCNAIKEDPRSVVAEDCRRVCGEDDDWVPDSSQDIANRVFHTSFMGTEYSSEETLSRAKRVADRIGTYHQPIKIDSIVAAIFVLFYAVTNLNPRFESQGGTKAEDLALQNVQARIRMVVSYLFAQLLPLVRKRKGFLLVLGSANVDEGLRGYMTKYDCSSADLNPIGAISKGDLKRMLVWAADEYDSPVLCEVANAVPTAELVPIVEGGEVGEHTQSDEEDMGMSYADLGQYGRLRKLMLCGPVSMFRKLCVIWSDMPPSEVAAKVKRFFFYYSANRHKMCTITPAYHAEGYSPDDNRFDLRQFLYNTKWTRQFAVIDKNVLEMEKEAEEELKTEIASNTGNDE